MSKRIKINEKSNNAVTVTRNQVWMSEEEFPNIMNIIHVGIDFRSSFLFVQKIMPELY